MIVKINNVDVSDQVIAPTVKGVKNSNFQNDFSFTIMSNDTTLRAGMEVEIFEDDGITKMIGGLMQQPEKSLISPTKMLQNIVSTGYKQILARRSFNVYVQNQNSGDVVEQAFDDFLAVGSDFSEELTKGTIDTGVNVESYIGVFSAFKFYTDMAQISGLRWWIDDDKVFNFTTAPTYTTITTKLTDEDAVVDKFEILNYPKYKEDLSKYRNRQYMIGKDENGLQIIGLAIDSTEEARLAALYGSGVYSNIMRNDNVKTQTDADAAALAELNAYSIIPAEIEFKTRDFIDVNQRILVHLDAYGIDDEYFISEKVEFSYDNTEEFMVYNVKLKKHIETAKQPSSWTEDWNTALNDAEQQEKPKDQVRIVEVTNTVDYSGFTTEQILDGISVDFTDDSKISAHISMEITPSVAMNLTVKFRVDGSPIHTRVYDLNALDTIDATCEIEGIAAGTKVVDVTVTPSTGNGTILAGDYQLHLIISDVVSEPEPAPAGPAFGYIYGGLETGYDQILDCDGYDPDTDGWTNKTDTPAPARGAMGASTISSKGYIYAGFGSSRLQDCDEFDASGNSWAGKTDTPTPARNSLAASTIDTKGYIYGGYTGSRLLDCDEFDASGNSWASKSNMPSPGRQNLAGSTIESKGYVYAGYSGSWLTDCDEYTPSGDSWSSKTSMPSPARNYHAASTIDTKGYVYGGQTPTLIQDCDEFDASGNSWASKTNIPTPARYYHAASTAKGKGQIYGGSGSPTFMQDTDEYTASADTWANKTNIPSPARLDLASSSI